jgi:hypothetical protein
VRQGFIDPPIWKKLCPRLPIISEISLVSLTSLAGGWEKFVDWNGRKLIGNQRRFFLGVQKMESRGFFLRILPLVGELDKIIDRRWQARTIATKEGSTRLSGYVFHCGDGRPIGDFRKAWGTACTKAAMTGLLFHDLRRSAVRNLDRNGVSQVICTILVQARFSVRGRRAFQSLDTRVVRVVGAVGVEPTTNGLKGRCSATELRPY